MAGCCSRGSGGAEVITSIQAEQLRLEELARQEEAAQAETPQEPEE